MIITIQIIGLFCGIWFTFVNVVLAVRDKPITWENTTLMSASWTAFITATWLV